MTIIFRVIVGVVCDVLGARRGLAFLLLLACPGILGMMSAAEQEWTAGSDGEGAFPTIAVLTEQRTGLDRDHSLSLLASLLWGQSCFHDLEPMRVDE